MPSVLPPNQSALLAELLRRIDRLESAARVPQITRISGGANGLSVDDNQPFAPAPDDWTAITGGPVVPFTVTSSGRVIVWMEAIVLAEGGAEFAGVDTSYALEGPSEVAPDLAFAVSWFVGGGGSRSSTFYVHEDLEPGEYTLRMKVRNTGFAPTTSTWIRRNVALIPL